MAARLADDGGHGAPQELKPPSKDDAVARWQSATSKSPTAGAHMQPTSIPRTWGRAGGGDLNATKARKAKRGVIGSTILRSASPAAAASRKEKK